MIKLYGVSFIIVLIIIVCAYWYFECYRNYKSGCVSKISFQKFLEVYENAYHKISLNRGHFYYSPDPYGVAYNFYFSIPDTFRYEHWRKVLERKDQEERKNYKLIEIEKAWQKDAEHHKEKEMKNGT